MSNKIIDIHAHLANIKIYPDYWINGVMNNIYKALNGKEDADKIVKALIKTTLNDFDCKKLIKSMDNSGIDKTVIVMADFGYGVKDMEFSLRDIYDEHRKSIAEYKDRLIVFAGCDPRRGKEGYELFENGINEYDFKGLKLYPPCGFELDDKELFPLYEICNKYELPILVHTGKSLESMKSNFKFPQSLKNVAKQYKDCKFILGHGAIQEYDVCYELPLMFDNIFLELSGFHNYICDKETDKKD